ncbi:MAG: hydrogenase iron-sulfur subunit [Deltaproteobacteria bacterium]|nr:hydrogenase iron-sulfur subunit [Deltaproteobacteria bacterium]
MSFEPRIVAFLCNWCSYTGADLAGTARMRYPPNVVIIRVMCSGRVSPLLVMSALKQGADAVLICGCHIGDCHYTTGNWQTEKRIPLLRKALEMLGIDPRRVRLEWVSASEGARFVELIEEYVAEIRQLGPNPLTGAQDARTSPPSL